MREIRGLLLPALVAGALAGCVLPSPPGPSVPARANVITADARALRYGSTAPEVFAHPELADRLRALFGEDWQPGRLTHAAPAFFPPSSAFRMVRVETDEFIAISGCVPVACGTHRGLLLIRQDAGRLLARLDEGGFSHYYEHGPGATVSAVPRPVLDGAWNAAQALDPR